MLICKIKQQQPQQQSQLQPTTKSLLTLTASFSFSLLPPLPAAAELGMEGKLARKDQSGLFHLSASRLLSHGADRSFWSC